MGLWDQVTSFLALNAFQESQADADALTATLEDLLTRVTGNGLRASPWRTATTRRRSACRPSTGP